MIRIQSIHSAAEEGVKRFLVDRRWPEGVVRAVPHKEAAGTRGRVLPRVDGWLPALAPSEALLKWFHHDTPKKEEFRRRYLRELGQESASWTQVVQEARETGSVTLVVGARTPDPVVCPILKDFITRKLGSGDPQAKHHKKTTAVAAQSVRPFSEPHLSGITRTRPRSVGEKKKRFVLLALKRKV